MPILLLLTALPLGAVTLKSSIGIYAGLSEIHIKSFEDDLPFHSAFNSEIVLTPISFGSDQLSGGLYLSTLYTSPTLVYDSIRYDSFIRGGIGAVLDYRFTEILEGEISAGAAFGRYLNAEAYSAAAETALALRIKPVEFLAFTPRTVFRAENGQFSISLQIGAAAEIRWTR